jgi:hypothetical protein
MTHEQTSSPPAQDQSSPHTDLGLDDLLPILARFAVQAQPRPLRHQDSEPVLPLVLGVIGEMGQTSELGGYALAAAACYRARIEMGEAKHGEPLHTFNGRLVAVDALQEALDGLGYVTAWRREREVRGVQPLFALDEALRAFGLALGSVLEAMHTEQLEKIGHQEPQAGRYLLQEIQAEGQPLASPNTVEAHASLLWSQVPQDGTFREVEALGALVGLTPHNARCAALWLVGPYGEPSAVLRRDGSAYLLARAVLPGHAATPPVLSALPAPDRCPLGLDRPALPLGGGCP